MQQHRPVLALSLRLGSALVFSVMFLLVKLVAERGVHVGEIVFWRQALTAPMLLLWLAPQAGGFARLSTDRLGAHALRATVGMSNMAILFTATALLPLAETTTLGFSTALFAVLIAAVVLREPVGPWRWGAVILGFAGVLVIAQPGGHHIDPLGATLGLVSPLVVAIINYQIRDLASTEGSISIVFWFGVFGSLIGAVALPFFYTTHDAYEWWLLLAIGLSGVLGQLLLTGSLRHAPVSAVVVMDYSGLVWSALLGWLAWSTVPPLSTWLGAPLIIGAGLVIVWRERVLAKAPSPVSPADTE